VPTRVHAGSELEPRPPPREALDTVIRKYREYEPLGIGNLPADDLDPCLSSARVHLDDTLDYREIDPGSVHGAATEQQ
jgi:hypothetical protein